MIPRNLAIIGLLTLAISCGNDQDNQLTRIKTQFTHTNYNTVYLHQLLPDQWIILDSMVTNDEGLTVFRLNVERAGLYTIGTDRDNLAILEINRNQDHKLLADIRQIPHTYTIEKGSEGSVMLEEFKKITLSHLNTIDSLLWEADSYQGEDINLNRSLTDSLIRCIRQQQKEQQEQLVRDHKDHIASLIPLFQPFGRERLFTPERYPDLFTTVHDQLMEKYPDNPHVLDLHQRMSQFKEQEAIRRETENQLQPSMVAPDFSLSTIDEQRVNLEQFQGQYVLLHFWTNKEEDYSNVVRSVATAASNYPNLITLWIYHGSDRLIWRDAANRYEENSIHARAEPMVLNAYNTSKSSRTILIDPRGKILENQISHHEICHILSNHINK